MPAKKPAKTIADFRAAHDPAVIVPNRITTALAGLLSEGPEQWEYEVDFIKRAGISPVQIGQFRDQFKDYIVETSNSSRRTGVRVWFGSVKAAAKARG